MNERVTQIHEMNAALLQLSLLQHQRLRTILVNAFGHIVRQREPRVLCLARDSIFKLNYI